MTRIRKRLSFLHLNRVRGEFTRGKKQFHGSDRGKKVEGTKSLAKDPFAAVGEYTVIRRTGGKSESLKKTNQKRIRR